MKNRTENKEEQKERNRDWAPNTATLDNYLPPTNRRDHTVDLFYFTPLTPAPQSITISIFYIGLQESKYRMQIYPNLYT